MAVKTPSTPKIIFLFILATLLVLAFLIVLSPPGSDEPLESSAFSGVLQPDAKTLHVLFPQSQNQPMLIEFTSKYCIDCKRLKPVLERVIADYPTVHTHIFDVQSDRKANAKVFEAFRPMVVPALILVYPDGSISRTFLEVADETELRDALNTISISKI